MIDLENALKELGQQVSSSNLKKAYQEISEAYRNNRPLPLNSVERRTAYALARMPATVSVLDEVLSHLKPYFSHIKSLLDLGTGPGSILWALKENTRNMEKITLIDQETSLMELGKKLITPLSLPHLSWTKARLPQLSLDQSYDLITLSYFLNELSLTQQLNLIEYVWPLTNQFLLIVEPGTPEGFKNIKEMRNLLIQRGAKILAPCTHENICPMTPQDWCHFSKRLQRSPLHRAIKGSLPYEDEKYSFIIATKLESFERDSARIVKKPKKSKGLIELEVCKYEGLDKIKVTRKNKCFYEKAKKLKWGHSIK